MSHPIVVSAVVLRDERDRLLMVRKRGTGMYMLPGGKPEPGETATEAAIREIEEEVGLRLDPARLVPVGEFLATAANELGVTVRAMVFDYPGSVATPAAAAEIDDLRWLAVDEVPVSTPSDVAPLLIDHVLRALERPHPRWVTVFAGSARGADDAYAAVAAELGELLAEEGIGIVYGGGAVGLMGVLADAALAAGGDVVGVMPQSLVSAEIAHSGLTRLEVVPGLHERKQRMAELGEAFVALPGGSGTLEELFEVWTWQQLGLHTKPVACLDAAGFWQPLFDLVDASVDTGFLTAERRASLLRAGSATGVLDELRTWRPLMPKWVEAQRSARSSSMR